MYMLIELLQIRKMEDKDGSSAKSKRIYVHNGASGGM